jgi:hypothetical protein
VFSDAIALVVSETRTGSSGNDKKETAALKDFMVVVQEEFRNFNEKKNDGVV